MARVYLDVNKVFDIIIRKPEETSAMVAGHQVFTSPLSFHIFCYAEGVNMPDKNIGGTASEFEIVDFTRNILLNAFNGPTNDFEDNVQLHSAAEAQCDYFVTNDRKLLKTGFFGKTKIVDKLD